MTIERQGGSQGDKRVDESISRLYEELASVFGPDVTDNGQRTEHITGPLAELKLLRENDPTFGFRIDGKTQEKVLAIVDQVTDYPEAVGEFLKHPHVSDNPIFENQPVLEALPARHGEKVGGEPSLTTMQLLAFALQRSESPSNVIQALANSLLPEAQTQLERLREVMIQVGVVADGLTQEEQEILVEEVDSAIEKKRKEAAAELARIARVQAEALAEKEEQARQEQFEGRERGQKEEERKKEQTRQIQEWKRLSQALVEDPETTFSNYRTGNWRIYNDNPLAQLSVSSRYLSVTNGEGDVFNTIEAQHVINDYLNNLLPECDDKNPLSNEKVFSVIKPHLHRLYPDMQSLEKLVTEYPSLREDGDFFMAWKKALTDDKIRKDAEALLGNKFGNKELEGHDISRLTFQVEQYLGVPYSSMEEMYRDMEQYLAYPIGGEGHNNKLPKWAKSNKAILKIVYNDLLRNLSEKSIKSKVVNPRATIDEHATNELNVNQCFLVNERETADGEPIYYLLLDQVHNYAAFFDKEVTYIAPKTNFNISMNLNPLPEWTPQQKIDLHERCEASGDFPTVSNTYTGDNGSQEYKESWPIRYDKRPNEAVVALLREYVGKVDISYSLDDKDKKIKLADAQPPSVKETLEVVHCANDSLEANPVKLRTVTRESVAKFHIAATPTQMKLLEALKVALPQSQPPLPDMLY